jgi:hypothetical protein
VSCSGPGFRGLGPTQATECFKLCGFQKFQVHSVSEVRNCSILSPRGSAAFIWMYLCRPHRLPGMPDSRVSLDSMTGDLDNFGFEDYLNRELLSLALLIVACYWTLFSKSAKEVVCSVKS